MAKILDILVESQIKRSVLVPCDQNFQITFGGGPLISFKIFQPKFAVPFSMPYFSSVFLHNARSVNTGRYQQNR